MKTNTKTAPKLPRFVAPKNMTSRIFIDKKRKSMSRAALKSLVNF